MSNLEQIAKLSGFSKATVSRVLNKSRHVSPDTRAKILQVIQEMDYVPNRNAISLSKGKTLQIGMITTVMTEIILPFMTSFVEVAAEHGFQTIIYTSDSDQERELQAFEDLKQKRVDGLLIITCVNELSVVSSYGKYGPIVSWQRMDRPDIPSVAMDQYDGYALAIEHLLSQGITRIANAFGRPSSLNTRRRIQAYEDSMNKHQLEIRKDWYFDAVYHLEHGQDVVRRLLGIPSDLHSEDGLPGKNLPQAIVCANDYVAAGVLSEARRHGWNVPGELRIVSFDNMQIAQTLGITSVQNPIRDQAYNAFALLSPSLLNRQLPLKPLDFSLAVRETT
ncbi:LacI family DNA-binding transcriptional regulator [Saccharibacillus sp. JS10]|uniref:LacI family DNA-binding transcriptional regulator n=1 Tax=Saccharibacillus sp. JS10 TaxID=2950552 RepID=UPI00210EA63C|nr:LacI family DNA-binding transcriptional regulator [Saccharibacillus sp. JS10]MCQ4087425.1 LacI family transcriptional regulator [Saccharibacillus sp. JS10]